jgi:hypothetical protein
LILNWSVVTYGMQKSASSANDYLSRHRHPLDSTSIKDAGNSTLGFSSIFYVNMKTRYDRLDAISIQSFLSGVTITQYPAVEKETIHDKGLPPSKSPGYLNKGQIGCWRAHANVSKFAIPTAYFAAKLTVLADLGQNDSRKPATSVNPGVRCSVGRKYSQNNAKSKRKL